MGKNSRRNRQRKEKAVSHFMSKCNSHMETVARERAATKIQEHVRKLIFDRPKAIALKGKACLLRTFNPEISTREHCLKLTGSFITSFMKTLGSCQHKGAEAWQTADAIVQTVNESSDYVYSVMPEDEKEVVSSFAVCCLPVLRLYARAQFQEWGKWHPGMECDKKVLDLSFFNIDIPGQQSIQKASAVPKEFPLKQLLETYAHSIRFLRALSLSNLQFEVARSGAKLFVSELGKAPTFKCGVWTGDAIIVSPKFDSPEECRLPLESLSANKKVKIARGVKATNSTKRKTQLAMPKNDPFKEDLRVWMEALSHVHEEAEQISKKTREKLNAMNLKCTAPKERKQPLKSEEYSRPINNSLTCDLGGKAGKAHFFIRVGAVENLYKTLKSNSNGTNHNNATRKLAKLDLHGCTKDEALTRLNKNLPKWVDAAMKGEYPWVLPVEIVCGCGNQVLSEVVGVWIKVNVNVCNAPKSIRG